MGDRTGIHTGGLGPIVGRHIGEASMGKFAGPGITGRWFR